MRGLTTYALLLLPAIALADQSITFTMVGEGEAGAAYTGFENYTATAVTTQGSMTTYILACATSSCDLWGNETLSYTLAVGPSTEEWRWEAKSAFSAREACSLTGTEAQCTGSRVVMYAGTGTSSFSSESTSGSTYTVPESGSVLQTAMVKLAEGKATLSATTAGPGGKTGTSAGNDAGKPTGTAKPTGGDKLQASGVAVAGMSVESWMVGAGIGFWGAFIGV